MTLDDAIEKYNRLANNEQTCYPEEAQQLAEWLEELKMYKSLAPRELVSEKQKNDRAIEYNKGFDVCCESMEAMAQIIDIAKVGWTKEQIMEWLQKEQCEVPE